MEIRKITMKQLTSFTALLLLGFVQTWVNHHLATDHIHHHEVDSSIRSESPPPETFDHDHGQGHHRHEKPVHVHQEAHHHGDGSHHHDHDHSQEPSSHHAHQQDTENTTGHDDHQTHVEPSDSQPAGHQEHSHQDHDPHHGNDHDLSPFLVKRSQDLAPPLAGGVLYEPKFTFQDLSFDEWQRDLKTDLVFFRPYRLSQPRAPPTAA